MSSPLYNREILRLAASAPPRRRLDSPDSTSERRSPTCGSRVRVDVLMDAQGRVADLAMEVSACALGQASAALLCAHARGRSSEELAVAAEALKCWLAQPDAETEPGFWPGIEALGVARAYPARHASILLAFEAAAEATALWERTA